MPEIRLASHIRDARIGEKSLKSRWISRLLDLGLSPELEILETCEDSNWQERERWWIAEMRKQAIDLSNVGPGGWGR